MIYSKDGSVKEISRAMQLKGHEVVQFSNGLFCLFFVFFLLFLFNFPPEKVRGALFRGALPSKFKKKFSTRKSWHNFIDQSVYNTCT